MAISYGQWLFWIWIGGIGLSLFKCGEWQLKRVKPQDLAWWVPSCFQLAPIGPDWFQLLGVTPGFALVVVQLAAVGPSWPQMAPVGPSWS